METYAQLIITIQSIVSSGNSFKSWKYSIMSQLEEDIEEKQ